MYAAAKLALRPKVLLISTLVKLQVLDILTTGPVYAAQPLVAEGNPVTRRLVAEFGMWWWWPKLAVVAIIAAILASWKLSPRTRRIAYILTWWYIATVTWNVINRSAEYFFT